MDARPVSTRLHSVAWILALSGVGLCLSVIGLGAGIVALATALLVGLAAEAAWLIQGPPHHAGRADPHPVRRVRSGVLARAQRRPLRSV